MIIENDYDLRIRSQRALKKMKEIEASSKMFQKRIDKNTVVASNKKSNLELYER